ncbi:hypothetical protein QLX67_01315 [Balneolaceae bacterium ANBcel3]|nr:hypothetical protein [Balneolaceae bacterium ANBcel3]
MNFRNLQPLRTWHYENSYTLLIRNLATSRTYGARLLSTGKREAEYPRHYRQDAAFAPCGTLRL